MRRRNSPHISIHAPARGATLTTLLFFSTSPISIHAPARGATPLTSPSCIASANFNPRSREGSDSTLHISRYRHTISIHAPARGATLQSWHSYRSLRNFNPRSREGSDELNAYERIRYLRFQSTLPRGERRTVTIADRDGNKISIHAPARGATRCSPFRLADHNTFQSTLPRGERRSIALIVIDGPEYISIHAPARGATLTVHSFCRLRIISIHAPARGATSILSKIHPMFLTISHNASSFSSFPFHSFLPHLLNSSTFCALFQVRISRAFSVYYRFAPKKSTPDL